MLLLSYSLTFSLPGNALILPFPVFCLIDLFHWLKNMLYETCYKNPIIFYTILNNKNCMIYLHYFFFYLSLSVFLIYCQCCCCCCLFLIFVHDRKILSWLGFKIPVPISHSFWYNNLLAHIIENKKSNFNVITSKNIIFNLVYFKFFFF